MKLSGRAQEDLTPSSLEGRAHEVGGPGPPGRGLDNGRNTIDAYTTKERNTAFPLTVILCVTGRNLPSVVQVGQVENGVNIGPVLHRLAQNDSLYLPKKG